MRSECEAIFLFIAELTGSFVPGSGDVEDKIKCGQQDYCNNYLLELDLEDEEDRKDLHENIWLERLYAELDTYFSIQLQPELRNMVIALNDYRKTSYQWTVPIELDASASMLQYMGLLLGDKRLMEMTNVIGDTLADPWKLDGMPRKQLKTAATPMLYGSSQTCYTLWRNAGIEYSMEDVNLYNQEMAGGAFGIANMFKEFIINNVRPKTEMSVRIWDEEFDISCNRFRSVGEKTKAYKIWDSVEGRYETLLHTETKKVPDLDQFRRYFVTLLIHNLDSQVADTVIGKTMHYHGWGIPIHDAFIVSPAAAWDVRNWYAKELEKVYKNRKEILGNYFRSIGITGTANKQWKALMDRVEALDGDIKINPMALK